MKIVIPIVIIVLSVGMFFVYIIPAWAEIGTLKLSLADYTNIQNKTKELADKRDEVEIAYDSIPENDIAKLNKIIPDTFSQVFYANDLNNIALRDGIQIKDFKVNVTDPNARAGAVVETVATNSPYKTTLVQITMSGTYEQFIRFLQDIETNLQLADVQDISMKASADQTGANYGNLDYVIQMNTYSLK